MNLPHSIHVNEPIGPKTWFGSGGNARYYCQPRDEATWQEALAFAATHDIPCYVLGEGANVLVSDEGFDGLVIRPYLDQIKIEGSYVTAGAGVSFHDLITTCLEACLLGLEEFSGIPGTVGGAVFINIHYFHYLLSHFLVSARVINVTTGDVMEVDAPWFQFAYDYSRLHEGGYYVTQATFHLTRCTKMEAAFAQGRATEIIRHRKHRYPHHGTCGSFFRNFLQYELARTSSHYTIPAVAYYLDAVGVKGRVGIGGAQVSAKHANMIVNDGTATSRDIIAVAQEMQRRVHTQFGLLPQPECQLIGFNPWPLMRPNDEQKPAYSRSCGVATEETSL